MEVPVRIPIGDIELEGLLSVPEPPARVAAVVCHPHPLYGGDMRSSVVAALVASFQAAGIATLRFNFRGVGRSGGRHDEGRGEVEDVTAAVDMLLARCAAPLVAVAGYSFGSMVGLRAGAADARIGRLIGVALPIARRDADFLAGVTKPILLVSGDQDDISPADRMRELASSLTAPTSLVLIRSADHFLTGWEAQVAQAATAFLIRPTG